MKKGDQVINVMQKYLQILRKVNGWTAEEMGNRLGVTKQTISNLENGKVCMTKTQYIALRTIFENEIRNVDNNLALKRIMCILFYDETKFGEAKEQQIYQAMETVAAAAYGGITGSQLALLATTVLAPLKLASGINIDMDLKSETPYKWVEILADEEDA